MNEPTTIDEAAKGRIKSALVAHVHESLAVLTGQVDEDHAASERTGSGATSVDDLSQADEAGDLGGLVDRSAARAGETLDQIEALDFSPTEVVRPGAVVGFDGSRYVVGVAVDEFDCDGISYAGISADSPLAAQILGLHAGDEVTFDGRVHSLEIVS